MKARIAASVLLFVAIGSIAGAQAPTRRATSPAALLAYPGFFQGQAVVVRGLLSTRDQAVLTSPAIDRSIPLIFSGPSPADGQVELRATFWDIGRLQRDDPRLTSLGLLRLLPNGVEGDWPRPGEVVVLIVSNGIPVKPSTGPPTLRDIALSPEAHVGEHVTLTGQFRGRNLYGDLPQAPGLSQWDFVLRSTDAAVWITGERPRGKGFNLDVGARVDTRAWLQAIGTVREARGMAWIQVTQSMTLVKPETGTYVLEPPITPEVGPAPEVIFSDPENGEVDVSLKKTIRIQFSRDMDPNSFKDKVSWHYAASDSRQEMPSANLSVRYEKANRSVEVKISADAELTRYRNIALELGDGIIATDGAKLKPWSLTFTFAGE